jgi:uncharacterized protein YndB with AHSA1/START domain
MDKPKFVYVTDIAAPATKVWEALTSTEWTRRYWNSAGINSDWKLGSSISEKGPEGEVRWHGEILSSEPPHRITYTFDVRKPGSGSPEAATKVTYELTSRGDATRLTVTHENFSKENDIYEGISGGWPAILSALKTLLETGEARLPVAGDNCGGK